MWPRADHVPCLTLPCSPLSSCEPTCMHWTCFEQARQSCKSNLSSGKGKWVDARKKGGGRRQKYKGRKLYGSDSKSCRNEVTATCTCAVGDGTAVLFCPILIKKHKVSHEAYPAYNWLPKKPGKTTRSYFLSHFLELWLKEERANCGQNHSTRVQTARRYRPAQCPAQTLEKHSWKLTVEGVASGWLRQQGQGKNVGFKV